MKVTFSFIQLKTFLTGGFKSVFILLMFNVSAQSSKMMAIDISPRHVLLDSVDLVSGKISLADTLRFKFDAFTRYDRAFDTRHGRYLLECDTAIIVITDNGRLHKIIHKPYDVEGMVYDPITDKVFCSLWKSGTYWFARLDIAAGAFTIVRSLSDKSVHTATLDYDNRYYYIISDNRGLLKINMQTGIKEDSVKYFTTNNCMCNVFDVETGKIATTCVLKGQNILQLYSPSNKLFETIDTIGKYGSGFFSYESAVLDQNNGNWYLNLGKSIGIKNIRTGKKMDTFNWPFNRIRSLALVENICYRPMENIGFSEQIPSCIHSADGVLSPNVKGGRKPYLFSKDSVNFDTVSLFRNLEAGKQRIYIRDKNGFCNLSLDYMLSGPAPLLTESLLKHNSCHDDTFGSVSVMVKGGSRPYFYALNNGPYGTDSLMNGLHAGIYTVVVKDRNGCKDTMENLEVMSPPEFRLKNIRDTTLCNGQSMKLDFRNPNVVSSGLKSNTGLLFTIDTVSLNKAGTYFLEVLNSNHCAFKDTFEVNKIDMDVIHDFLIPSYAHLSDTVYAVNITYPFADSSEWDIDKITGRQLNHETQLLRMHFSDTGRYNITLSSRFNACGFVLTKSLTIRSDSDFAIADSGFRNGGPMIQKFEVNSNPHDGQNFKINIQLRDTADFMIYKINPGSGHVAAEMSFEKLKSHEFTAFTSFQSEVYYLKLIVGRESKTIKVVAVQ